MLKFSGFARLLLSSQTLLIRRLGLIRGWLLLLPRQDEYGQVRHNISSILVTSPDSEDSSGRILNSSSCNLSRWLHSLVILGLGIDC